MGARFTTEKLIKQVLTVLIMNFKGIEIDRKEWTLVSAVDCYLAVFHNRAYWESPATRTKLFQEALPEVRAQNFIYYNGLECYESVRKHLQGLDQQRFKL